MAAIGTDPQGAHAATRGLPHLTAVFPPWPSPDFSPGPAAAQYGRPGKLKACRRQCRRRTASGPDW